jgi:hypothetical protein
MSNNCETCIRLIKKRGITNSAKLSLKYCNKCKEEEKANILKSKIEELKQKVNADPDALLKASTDFWSEQAIKYVAEAKPELAMQIAKMYPSTRCYMVHKKDKQESILYFLEKCYFPIRETARLKRVDLQKKAVINQAREIPIWARFGWHFLGGTYAHHKPDTGDLTYNDFLELVAIEPGALEFVPELWRDYTMCITAMRNASENAVKIYHCNGEGFPLIHVPLIHRDEEMCLTAAAWCNRALWFFPQNMRRLDIYIKCAYLNPSTVNTTMPEPFCKHPDVLKAMCESLGQVATV